MLSLIRGGPKTLIMASNVIEELTEFIEKTFPSSICSQETTFAEAFENSSEEHTIVWIVDKLKDVVHLEDIKQLYNIKEEPDVILCNFLNNNCNLITNCRIAPRILIMRAMGNIEKIITEIQKDYKTTSGTFLEMLDNHNDKGTVLAFTSSPLNKKISIKNSYQTTLFFEEKYTSLRRELRLHGLKYLNEGLDNKDWHDLEIKIYDKYEAYDLHYKRLLKILEYLELGIILGESWGKDAAHVLLVVGVYRLRFFTFFEPKFIKKILLGLEYLDDGTRIVDYDVYHKRRKMYWTDVRENNVTEKNTLSKKYRDYIFAQLTERQKEEILAIEEQILRTRY